MNPSPFRRFVGLGLLLFVAVALFTCAGGKKTGVVLYKSYAKDDVDFSALLTDIKRVNPDVIFLPDYYQKVGLIAKKARELGITAKLLGGDGWDSPEMVRIAGTAIDGGYFTNHYSPDDQRPEVQEFVRKYQAKHNSHPDALATLAYDATRIMLEAIRRAALDAVAATDKREKPPATIRLGLVAPLTGDVKTFGESTRNGFQLAVDEANAQNFIPGIKIEPIIADDKNDPTECANAGSKLINQDGVKFIVGSVASKCSNPLSEIAQTARVLMISTASTNPLVTVTDKGVRKDYVFRACYIDPFQGAVAAKFARDNLKAKTAAVLYDVGNDYSKGLAEFFRSTFENHSPANPSAPSSLAPREQPPATKSTAPLSFTDQVRDAMASMRDFATVSGKISFDAQGNPLKSAVIIQYQNGQQKYISTVEP